MIQRFRDKHASVFLISLKAGGFGLNLAEADYCFVLDPWWNRPPKLRRWIVRIGSARRRPSWSTGWWQSYHRAEGHGSEGAQELFASVVGSEALASAALTAEEIRGLLGG